MGTVRRLNLAAHGTASRAPVTARVYRRLLTDLMIGELPPGSRLPLHSLARRYATSSASVRQALLQLSAEGLIHAETAQGFRAATTTADDLLDLMKALTWLASIGVRESIANGDAHWDADVLGKHRAFIQSIQGPGIAGCDELPFAGERFLEYHDALVGACRSHNLVDFCRSLNRRLLRYRNLTGIAKPEEREWAGRIRNAALGRDVARTVLELESYYRFLTERAFSSGLLSGTPPAEDAFEPAASGRRAGMRG